MKNAIGRFTREQLELMTETDHAQYGDVSSMARALLSVMDAKPREPDILVSKEGAEAIRAIINREMSSAGRFVTFEGPSKYHMDGIMPLYTTPPADSVPDGWQLAPVEPTDEMISAGDRFMDGLSHLRDAYSAMLNAAPAAPEN